MKRNLFAIFLALALVVALAFVVAPTAKAEAVTFTDGMEIDTNTTIDLAGQSGTITLKNGAKLSVIDSKNTGVKGDTAGKLTVKGDGEVVIEATDAAGRRFLAVQNDDDTYSFHPFFVGIEKVGVNTNKTALCLKAIFVTNEVAQKKISTGMFYGATPDDLPKAADTYGAFSFVDGVMEAYFDLAGSLDSQEAIDASRSFQAYIKVGEEAVTNKVYTVTPSYVISELDKIASEFNDTLKAKMVNMITGKAHLEALCPNFLGKEPEPVEVTLDFTDAANRISSSTTQQVWEQNGITLTYAKNNYNNNLAEYTPVRFYAGTLVTIEFEGITTLVFNCVDNSYASALATSISGANVSCDGTEVFVELTEASDSFSFSPTTQTRVNSLTVSNAPLCAHEGGEANCVERAKCAICNKYYGTVSEYHTDMNYDHICDVKGCGNTMVGECADGDDADSLCDYGANHADGCKKDFNSTVKTPYTATISFGSTTDRVSQTASQQVWAKNELTFTNDKASSSSDVANYSNPIRLYGGSTITIAAPGMTEIKIVCNSSKYTTVLTNSLTAANISYTSSGNTVTIAMNGEDSVTFSLTAQTRFNSMTVSGNK